MRKRQTGRQHRSPRADITRLDDAIRREGDKVEKERLRQHREHLIRTQNSKH